MATTRKFEAHPESAPGDFYVVNGECISCGAPHAVAPDLIGWASSELNHCIWKKQPGTKVELEQAFAAFDASEIGCYRYAGTDPSIMRRIGTEYCDHASSASPEKLIPPAFAPRLALIDHHGNAMQRLLVVLMCTAVLAVVIWLLSVRL